MSNETVFANVMCNPSRDYLGTGSAAVAGMSAVVVPNSIAPRVHFTRSIDVIGAVVGGLTSSTLDTTGMPKQAHSVRVAGAVVKPAAFDAAPQADRWAIRPPRGKTPES
jgi:hypothetical protein